MKTKQILFRICLLAMALLLPAVVQAQFYYTNGVDIYSYTITAGNITITRYLGFGSAVTIPDTINSAPVTGIDSDSFVNNTSVSGIMLGTNISNIGAGAFYGCPDLLAIIVNAANPDYSDVDGVLFNKNQITLVAFPGGVGGNYSVPNGVTNIEDYAFADCPNLTDVTIPNGVTSIGNYAFDSCINLTNITIPNGIKRIGVETFAYSSHLTSLIIPNTVTSIGESAFGDCTSLTNITIPSSVTNIEDYAFFDCASLASLTIPNGVTSIGIQTFYACDSLTNITIPNSVTNIGQEVFEYCTSLANITIPASVTSIAADAFYDCTILTGVYFQGNAPTPNSDTTVFSGVSPSAEAYYLSTATGWGTNFDGLPTSLYFPGNLMVNGGFETGDFTGWLVSGGSASILTNPLAHTGLYAAQFSGARGANGIFRSASVEQLLTTQPGRVYSLSLWINSPSPTNDIEVYWNGNDLGDISGLSTSWVHISTVATAIAAQATLQFVSVNSFALDDVSVVPLAGYDQIKAQLVKGGVQLSFLGLATTNYALDRTFNLSPPIAWVPQSTNAAGANGMLLLTNAPVTTTNNFWRIRSVP